MERTPPPGRGHMAGCPAGLESRAGQLTTVFAGSCAILGVFCPDTHQAQCAFAHENFACLRADPFASGTIRSCRARNDEDTLQLGCERGGKARHFSKHSPAHQSRAKADPILDGIAVGGRVAQARHAHAQLIQVLTQRLVGA